MPLPIFAIEGPSLIDRIERKIPTFRRGSPVRLVSYDSKSPLTISMVKNQHPAVYQSTGGILLEKAAMSLLTHNNDLSQNKLWIPGQNVSVYPDSAIAPDGTKTADLISWSAVTQGASQSIQRTLSLVAERAYTLSFFIGLAPKGGKFDDTGEIRLSGNLIPPDPIKLSTLNDFPGQYRFFSMTFKAGGRQPKLPASDMSGNTTDVANGYQVVNVTGEKVSLQIYDVLADDLKGGQLQFDNNQTSHTISGNSISTNGVVTISTTTPSLAGFGVTLSSKARIINAPAQSGLLTLYSEASATLMFAMCFLEDGDFPTSPIPCGAELTPRAQTVCTYPASPVQDLSTFAVFIHLDYWRGDGNIIDCGDFKVFIADKKLNVQVGGTQVVVKQQLPAQDLRLFIQVALEQTSVSIYIGKQLCATEQISRYKGTRAPLTLTTEGVRVLKYLFFFNVLYSGGTNNLGGVAAGELSDLIDNPELMLSAEMVAQVQSTINLPSMEVPGMPPPKASSPITSVTTSTRIVTVANSAGFSIGDIVVVLRDSNRTQVTWTSIKNIPSPGVFELENVAGINVFTDILVSGNFTEPGRASIRLPFDTKASGFVDANGVDATAKTLKLTTGVLSFTADRAFVLAPNGQDIKEVVVSFVDSANQRITVNSVEDIQPGHLIVQPSYETQIAPQNYDVSFTVQQPGIQVGSWASNAFVVLNYGLNKAYVTPVVTVNL